MIRGGILNSRARCALWTAPAAARIVARAAMAAAGAAAVVVAAAAGPALAAQRPGGPAASHTRPATRPHPAAPGRMSPGAPWAHIAAGEYYICGIRTDGTLWCWGGNDSGQLGIGSDTGQDLPRQVTTPAAGGWASIAGGSYHTCAIRTDGTLWCWGNNDSGQLGTGSESETSQDRPQQVTTPAPGGWTSVTAGGFHTCATRIGRHPVVLGLGQLRPARHRQPERPGPAAAGHHPGHGRLGQRHRRRRPHLRHPHRRHPVVLGRQRQRPARHSVTTRGQDLPQAVTGPAAGGWASVTAGCIDTCATRAGGTVWCWGDSY